MIKTFGNDDHGILIELSSLDPIQLLSAESVENRAQLDVPHEISAVLTQYKTVFAPLDPYHQLEIATIKLNLKVVQNRLMFVLIIIPNFRKKDEIERLVREMLDRSDTAQS